MKGAPVYVFNKRDDGDYVCAHGPGFKIPPHSYYIDPEAVAVALSKGKPKPERSAIPLEMAVTLAQNSCGTLMIVPVDSDIEVPAVPAPANAFPTFRAMPNEPVPDQKAAKEEFDAARNAKGVKTMKGDLIERAFKLNCGGLAGLAKKTNSELRALIKAATKNAEPETAPEPEAEETEAAEA